MLTTVLLTTRPYQEKSLSKMFRNSKVLEFADVDAATFADQSLYGFGICIRDDRGNFIRSETGSKSKLLQFIKL